MSAEVQQPVSQGQRFIHPNSLANLNRFVAGKSGNPGGMRKGQVYVSECYKRLSMLTPAELQTYEPVNVAEAIALKQLRNAVETGDALLALPSVKEITDRTEGKAPQKVNITAEINVTQVQVLISAATDLASRHGMTVEQAKERLLSLRPELRQLVDGTE